MTDSSRCPNCGKVLPADAPAGMCPRCLMQAGLSGPGNGEQNAGRSASRPSSSAAGFVPPDPASLAPHFPHLEILEVLGHGGMGAVYKARQTKLDRLVALKLIRPESAGDPAFAERFHREAKTLARLNHPNIVAVHDFGEVEIAEADNRQSPSRTVYYFLMEYVEGANLRQVMHSGELQPQQALNVVPQICEALQFAHDEGVVHRDIKPENILLDKRGRVKIADFGLAKLANASTEDFTLTGSHQVMGTLRYMAPEQMESSHRVDHRADIYSLGVVFYEMLTGQTPIGHFDPPSKSVSIDQRIDAVVLRSMAREPDRRYQRASEVKTDVESISQGGAVGLPPIIQPTEGGATARKAASAQPHSPPTGAAEPVDFIAVESELNGPSLAMIVFGLLIAIGHVVTVAACLSSPFDRDTAWIGAVGILVGLGMFVGGWSMRRLRSQGWAQIGVIAGLVPASPAFPLSAAISIWASNVMHRPHVRRAFLERTRQRQLQVVKAGPSLVGQAEPGQGATGAFVLTGLHVLLWAALLFASVWVVPRYIQMFDEFALELPAVSQLVIRASILVTNYWYLLVIPAIAGAVLDFAILRVVGRYGSAPQIILGLFVALIPVLLGIVAFLAIWLPMTKLLTDLS